MQGIKCGKGEEEIKNLENQKTEIIIQGRADATINNKKEKKGRG